MNTDGSAKHAVIPAAQKKEWRPPSLARLAIGSTASGTFVELPEEGFFEFLFCDDPAQPGCIITFPS